MKRRDLRLLLFSREQLEFLFDVSGIPSFPCITPESQTRQRLAGDANTLPGVN